MSNLIFYYNLTHTIFQNEILNNLGQFDPKEAFPYTFYQRLSPTDFKLFLRLCALKRCDFVVIYGKKNLKTCSPFCYEGLIIVQRLLPQECVLMYTRFWSHLSKLMHFFFILYLLFEDVDFLFFLQSTPNSILLGMWQLCERNKELFCLQTLFTSS